MNSLLNYVDGNILYDARFDNSNEVSVHTESCCMCQLPKVGSRVTSKELLCIDLNKHLSTLCHLTAKTIKYLISGTSNWVIGMNINMPYQVSFKMIHDDVDDPPLHTAIVYKDKVYESMFGEYTLSICDMNIHDQYLDPNIIKVYHYFPGWDETQLELIEERYETLRM